jgi:nuclear transport factor 2 (NTF2) superfamily protein
MTKREFAIRYTAAWNSADPHKVASHYAENGFLKVNDAAPAVGRDAIAEVAEGFMTAFPDMQLIMDDLCEVEDRIEYQWTFVGTNSGLDGSGNAVRFSGYEDWKFGEDGLVAESLGHFDADEYERQLREGVA